MKIAKFEFSLFGINTYVVYDPESRECIIVDPGMYDSREEEALRRFIESEGLKVTNIVDTHLHIDHAIGVEYAKKEYGVPLAAHNGDEFMGKALDTQAREFGMRREVKNVGIDIYLRDGDEIRIGDGALKVLHVPGHSPGSVALYDADDNFVITGDALFRGSVGRTDLPGGDTRTLIDAIESKLMPLPDETVVYPGHGPATTIGMERRTNPFLQH